MCFLYKIKKAWLCSSESIMCTWLNRISLRRSDLILLRRQAEAGGAFKVQVYSPFVFQNKTGREFSLKSKSSYGSAKQADLRSHSKEEASKLSTMYLFSHASDDRRNRALMRLENSDWSKVSFLIEQKARHADANITFIASELRSGRHSD